MSWRPKDWIKERNIFFETHQPIAPYYKTREIDYEASADAMLRALKKEAIYIRTVQGWKYLRDSYEEWLYGNRVGYLAFIEED